MEELAKRTLAKSAKLVDDSLKLQRAMLVANIVSGLLANASTGQMSRTGILDYAEDLIDDIWKRCGLELEDGQ